jgi:4-diphosphocytidyl-2-C-methyl-D-erythritol kinase
MTHNNTQSKPLISRLSPAKINLFLHIVGKRADGYHHLQTVFRLLDWGDYLHFLPTAWLPLANPPKSTTAQQHAAELCTQLITLTGADNITGSLSDNLIIKAADALLAYAILSQRLPTRLQEVSVTLDKHLPMGAGLGGGSSNAATTLLVLNELWQLHFSREQLGAIGVTLGADVPIFIFGQDAIAMGVGEQLTPINLPNQTYLILTPNAHVNTAQIFAHPKLNRNIEALTPATISAQATQYSQALNTPYHNVFTPVVESIAPAVSEALQYLQQLESQAVAVSRMTGSGSAVFLPLDQSITSNKDLLAEWRKNAPCPAYVVNNL